MLAGACARKLIGDLINSIRNAQSLPAPSVAKGNEIPRVPVFRRTKPRIDACPHESLRPARFAAGPRRTEALTQPGNSKPITVNACSRNDKTQALPYASCMQRPAVPHSNHSFQAGPPRPSTSSTLRLVLLRSRCVSLALFRGRSCNDQWKMKGR